VVFKGGTSLRKTWSLGMAPPFEDAVAAVEALIAGVFEYM